jgi:murein DD-endopeptidase MepM/ murein hydrolase activator NlpD
MEVKMKMKRHASKKDHYRLIAMLLLLGIVFVSGSAASYPVRGQDEIAETPTLEKTEQPEAATEPQTSEETEQLNEDNPFIIDYSLGEFSEDQILAINDFVNSNTERFHTQYRFYTVTVQYYDEIGLQYIKMYPTEVYESLWTISYNEETDVIHLTIAQTDDGWVVSFYKSQIQELFGTNTMNYSFPWTGGDIWKLTQGASGHFTNLGFSYDFSPNSNTNLDVLAIETGILEPHTCYLNDTEQAMVFIKHPNGDKSGYLHLSKSSIPNNLFNKTVPKGQVIGKLYTGTSKSNPNPACTDLANYRYATPCGCGYGVHLHFEVNKLIDIQGQSLPSLKVNNNYTSDNKVGNNNENISPTMITFNNRLLLTYRDANGKIQTETSSNGATWNLLPHTGGSTEGKISMAAFKDHIYQAVRGQDNKIYTRWSNNGTQWNKWSWINNSGSTKENVSMIVFNNRLYQTVVGENNKVYYRSTGNGDSWNTWTSKDGSGFSANGDVSMVLFKGKLYQAVRGQDSKVYTRSTSDGSNWSGWVQINQSGSTPNNIVMTVFNEILYQAVRGMDNKNYTRSTSDGNNWSGWTSGSSQETFSEVSMIAHGNRLYQAIRGDDNKIFTRHSSNGANWSSWQWINQSGRTRNSVGMHTFGQDLFQVVYGENNLVYLRRSNLENPDAWTDWVISTQLVSKILKSIDSHDGWVLEAGEFKDKGGSRNATASTVRIGDDAKDRQYRAILSFDTSNIPANAKIIKVTLKIKRAGITGTNPFSTHGKLLVDVRKGAFSDNSSLQLDDYQAAASKLNISNIPKTLSSGWHTKVWTSGIFDYINTSGITQFRLRFAIEDNDDFGADFLKIYSGDADEANRPQLIVEYELP